MTDHYSVRKLWLIFAQTATICLAILFVVSTLRPELVSWGSRGQLVTIREATTVGAEGAKAPSYNAAVARATPAVVNIFTSKDARMQSHPFMDDPLFRRFFGEESRNEQRKESSLGSGVIVSTDGYILTNHHVVEQADEIEIALADGRRARARIVGADPETDLAVLKADIKDVPSIAFGAAEGVRVGDVVLAIGNPFGVGQTVTMGIVSALGRTHLGINTFENFIQTDAAINPGNSGGALIDASGNLIGINTAIYSRTGGSQGIGFAIPESVAKQVLQQIVANGAVTRGWIGVEAQDLSKELADSFGLKAPGGALIAGVLSGGPAEKSGVKPGDILKEVEGKPVADVAGMLNLVAALEPGSTATLSLLRDQNPLTVKVHVAKRPAADR
ncbi:MAG: Do family serine endopeptidase [Burkholderiales bacterium]